MKIFDIVLEFCITMEKIELCVSFVDFLLFLLLLGVNFNETIGKCTFAFRGVWVVRAAHFH